MSNCGFCKAKVDRNSTRTKINCSGCDNIFHAACVKLNSTEIEFLKSKNKPWYCATCVTAKRNESRSDLANISVNSASKEGITLECIHKEIISIKGASVETINAIDSLCSRITSLEDTLKQTIEENINLNKKIVYLEGKLDKCEHMARANCLDFVNIPKSNEIDDQSMITKLITDGLGISFSENDIDYCYRKQLSSDNKPIDVVSVRFLRHNTVKAILRAKRDKLKKKQNINCSTINNSSRNIYINEWLSPEKRKLLLSAKQTRITKQYQFLWIRNGTILMRKKTGSETIYINNNDDLDKL